MAKIDVLNELSSAFDSFVIHEKLIPDLMGILKKASNKQKFFDLLLVRLDFLRKYGRLAQEYHKEFERINEEIYSMHVSVKELNVRVLYSFLEDGTILLHAFYERGGKSKTDYTEKLPEASQRKKSMLEE